MKNKKGLKISYILIALLLIYLTLRTSYVIIYDKVSLNEFFSIFPIRLLPIPFILCFHPYSLIWVGIYIIIYAWYVSYKNKPKADTKWKEIEHGSNEFQTKEEKKEFIKNCTDEIEKFTEDEIKNILMFLGER